MDHDFRKTLQRRTMPLSIYAIGSNHKMDGVEYPIPSVQSDGQIGILVVMH